jgi:hypothetical protein
LPLNRIFIASQAMNEGVAGIATDITGEVFERLIV